MDEIIAHGSKAELRGVIERQNYRISALERDLQRAKEHEDLEEKLWIELYERTVKEKEEEINILKREYAVNAATNSNKCCRHYNQNERVKEPNQSKTALQDERHINQGKEEQTAAKE